MTEGYLRLSLSSLSPDQPLLSQKGGSNALANKVMRLQDAKPADLLPLRVHVFTLLCEVLVVVDTETLTRERQR